MSILGVGVGALSAGGASLRISRDGLDARYAELRSGERDRIRAERLVIYNDFLRTAEHSVHRFELLARYPDRERLPAETREAVALYDAE